MISNEQKARFRGMLTLLLEKSKADAVDWQTTRDGYEAIFPNESITVGFYTPTSDPDYFWAKLQVQGVALIDIEANERDPDWQMLSELFNEASRRATGWDRALAEVERALKTGWRPPADSARAARVTEDDIPF